MRKQRGSMTWGKTGLKKARFSFKPPILLLNIAMLPVIPASPGYVVFLTFGFLILTFIAIVLFVNYRKKGQKLSEAIAKLAIAEQTAVETKPEQANEIEQTDFLIKLNHEIRTPFYGMFGSLSRLRAEFPELEQEEVLHDLECQARQAYFHIGEVLDFVWFESGNRILDKSLFNLKKELKHLIGFHEKRAAGKKYKFSAVVAKDMPENYLGDSFRLLMLLNKLLLKVTDHLEQGEVEFRVHTEDHLPNSGDLLRFELLICGETRFNAFGHLTDTNDAETQNEIYQLIFDNPDFSAKLYKKIIGEMGASLEIKKQNNKNIRLSMLICLDKAPQQLSVIKNRPLRILFVDDNLLNQRVSAIALRRFGYEVDLAENGEQAVKQAIEKAYDVILMDLQMPVMDGIEATIRIREIEKELKHRKSARIIAMTANVMDNVRKKCHESGCNDFLTKPFDLDKLPIILQSNTEPFG